MDHYKRTRLVAEQLRLWIQNPEREAWSGFCRRIRLDFGFGRSLLERILREDYPSLLVENDLLVRLVGV